MKIKLLVLFFICCVSVNAQIWTKQGVVFAPTSSDLTGGGLSGVANQSVIYEGNAQILSGNVFKMWYSAAGNKVGYAESTDGISWTRYNTDGYLFSGANTSSVQRVVKFGSTYYMYGGKSSWASITVWTSSDGITFSSHGTALSASGGSNWDSTQVYYLDPFYFDGSTYYASYVGINAGGTTANGIATSTDLLTWTNGGSAVLTNFGGQDTHAIGGKYYMWGSYELASPSQYPSDLGRSVSSNLSSWSAPVDTFHKTLSDEGVGTSTGTLGPPSLVQAGSNTYIFYTATPTENTANGYQILMASTPLTLAQIVTTNEGIVGSLLAVATDNFVRGSYPESPLSDGGNWTGQGSCSLKVVSANTLEASVINTACEASWTGNSWTDDQYSELTIGTLAGNSSDILLLWVRGGSTFANSSYQLNVSGTVVILYKNVSGVQTQLHTSILGGVSSGTVWRLEVVGSTINVYANGIITYTTTDTDVTTGKPGIGIYAETLTHATISLWTGGANQVSPTLFSPVAGSYINAQTVSFDNPSVGLPGFNMYYTTDGTTPTISSTLYTAPITVSSSETVKVLAVATGYLDSVISSAVYLLNSAGSQVAPFVLP